MFYVVEMVTFVIHIGVLWWTLKASKTLKFPLFTLQVMIVVRVVVTSLAACLDELPSEDLAKQILIGHGLLKIDFFQTTFMLLKWMDRTR